MYQQKKHKNSKPQKLSSNKKCGGRNGYSCFLFWILAQELILAIDPWWFGVFCYQELVPQNSDTKILDLNEVQHEASRNLRLATCQREIF